MKFRIFSVLFLVAIASISFGANVPVATPSYAPGITSNSGGAELPVSVTASTTTATNLFTSLPNNDFTHAIIGVSSGSIYLVGPSTIAASASTVGLTFTSSMTPITVELPPFAKEQGVFRIFGIGIDSVVKFVPMKGKAAFLK